MGATGAKACRTEDGCPIVHPKETSPIVQFAWLLCVCFVPIRVIHDFIPGDC